MCRSTEQFPAFLDASERMHTPTCRAMSGILALHTRGHSRSLLPPFACGMRLVARAQWPALPLSCATCCRCAWPGLAHHFTNASGSLPSARPFAAAAATVNVTTNSSNALHGHPACSHTCRDRRRRGYGVHNLALSCRCRTGCSERPVKSSGRRRSVRASPKKQPPPRTRRGLSARRCRPPRGRARCAWRLPASSASHSPPAAPNAPARHQERLPGAQHARSPGVPGCLAT